MNKERFQELFAKPEKLEDNDLIHLQHLIRDYPFFHNAHLLLLYGLYKQKSEKFDDQLKQSALFLSSRTYLVSSLFQGIPESNDGHLPGSDNYLENKTEEVVSSVIPDSTVEEIGNAITEKAVKESEPFENGKLSDIRIAGEEPDLEFTLDDSPPVDIIEQKDEEVGDKQVTANDLLEFDMNSSAAEDGQTEDLIDYFLKVNPRIVPKLDMEDARGDISTPGLEENDEIVTETLADIYEQQGHFLKARDAFEKLILKFPEKSTYFASRIKELDKRIK